MQELYKKIKRMQPIIKIRRDKVEEESMILARIRQDKLNIVSQMKLTQRRYMDGYNSLNEIRCAENRENIATLEEGLDSIKIQWQKLRLEVEKIENREKAQISRVISAERDLNAMEKLQQRYQEEVSLKIRRNDQKMLDEHALSRYLARLRES